jgi:putative glutamine amidotransferase
MPPTIAVAPCRSLPDYVESIRRVGATPWVLDPAADDPARVAGRASGLLLTGGGDVDPARYGEVPHPKVAGVDRGRDAYEINLIEQLRPTGLPVFAICRGLQVLNVALGGTLVQDIPSELPGTLPHSVTTPPCAIAHEVWINRGSRLWTVMEEKLADADTCAVNSRHHQAVGRLAAGLEVSATAPDGIVEGVEDPRAPFLVAVQWHPENFWRTGEFRSLFEGFVEACAGRRG